MSAHAEPRVLKIDPPRVRGTKYKRGSLPMHCLGPSLKGR